MGANLLAIELTATIIELDFRILTFIYVPLTQEP